MYVSNLSDAAADHIRRRQLEQSPLLYLEMQHMWTAGDCAVGDLSSHVLQVGAVSTDYPAPLVELSVLGSHTRHVCYEYTIVICGG